MSMEKIKVVLVDLSGTLHIENQLVPGSREALRKLRDSGLYNIKFVTNTTKESKSSLLRLVNSLGLEIERNELFTSLTAARNLIDKKLLRPYFFLEDEALEDFEGVDVSDPDAVVIGLAPDKFNYIHMNTAFRLISFPFFSSDRRRTDYFMF